MSNSEDSTAKRDRNLAETIRSTPAPAQLDSIVGTTVDGRYVVDQQLGQGGFGTIYLASDKKVVHRKVVVKVMRAEETTSDWSKRKFKQEVEALARIDHQSIVGVFDCGETSDGRPYIVMQYIEGVSLRQLMKPEGMEFSRVANIICQTGRALSAAHQVGILHRDLKPENIMIQTRDDDELVKIIDFGIAKIKDSVIAVSTANQAAVGTIAYMSPEQLSAQSLKPQSDIYALGVVAYEMLTGRRPTNPESAFQLLELQRAGVRVRPSDLRPNLQLQAEQILLKALSFEPGDRYERARDFGDLLSNALLNDDEETKLQSRQNERAAPPETPTLETAHVLFVDLVGYSRLLIDQQSTQLQQLQQIVLTTRECQRAHAGGELIRLPTADGVALVFFHDPEAPVRCAVEISQALRSNSGIQLRMGIHSGLVYRMADINTNMNVAGGGINLAQMVMACGDGGHILLSKRVADDLCQLARWSDHLVDLGDTEVRHGVRVHLFNLYGDDFGNAGPPSKFQNAMSRRLNKNRWGVWVATASAVLLVLLAIGWYALSWRQKAEATKATPALVPIGPERVLTYWLKVQKMNKQQPEGEPIQSAGDLMYFNGWRFKFCVQPAESGALYLVNVGPGKQNADEYNILFPLPGVGKDNPSLSAHEMMESDWARFVDRAGEEKIWIIWSTKQVAELDDLFRRAAGNQRNPGVIEGAADLARIQQYLAMFDGGQTQVIPDRTSRTTTVKGRGEVVVTLVKLDHE